MNFLSFRVSEQAKAIVAGVGAGAATAIASFSDVAGDGDVTLNDIVFIGLSVLAVYGITFRMPNK